MVVLISPIICSSRRTASFTDIFQFRRNFVQKIIMLMAAIKIHPCSLKKNEIIVGLTSGDNFAQTRITPPARLETSPNTETLSISGIIVNNSGPRISGPSVSL